MPTSPSCGHTLNFDNLHFTADELRSLNELNVTSIVEAPILTDFHTIVTGIKNDKRIGIIPGAYGLLLKAAQACNPTAQCIELTATEKTWEPRYLELINDVCIDEITSSLMRMYVDCADPYDLTKTQIFAFIEDRLSKSLPRELFRYAWFGDKNAASFPVGNLTPGIDPSYFNVMDGFFIQMAAIYAANPLQLNALPGNTQATYALQKSVATPLLMFNAINTLMDNAITELVQQPDKVLLVTRSVFDRLRRQLQALGTAFQDYKLMENGIELAKWDGTRMVSVPLWDEFIASYENNGTSWNDPHRAVFTTVSNLNIGMACTSAFENLKSTYDNRTRLNRIEASDAFDMKIIDDRLLMVGR